MKKFAVLFFITVIITLIIPVTSVLAQGNSQKSNIKILRKNDVINGDYLAAGEKVEVSGTVNGDVYALAGQVFVDGTINGDLIAAGGTVSVSGKISQNVRVAGGQVTISADIGRNASLAGGNIDLTNSAIIRGNLVTAGGNVTMNSQVLGDAKIGSGNLMVTNSIARNLEAAGDSIRLTSKSQIGGNFTYWGSSEASIDTGAIIRGVITRNQMPVRFKPPIVSGVRPPSNFFNQSRIFSLILTLILGIIIIKFFPKFSIMGADMIGKRPMGSLGRGILLFIIIPGIILLLIVTIIGIPLAVLFILLYTFILYIARILTIFQVGVYLSGKLGKKQHDVLAFVIGLLAYAILKFIPVLSGLATFLVTVFGLGAWYLTIRHKENKAPSKSRRLAGAKA